MRVTKLIILMSLCLPMAFGCGTTSDDEESNSSEPDSWASSPDPDTNGSSDPDTKEGSAPETQSPDAGPVVCSEPNPEGCTSDADCEGDKICNKEPCKSGDCTCTSEGYVCDDDCSGGVCEKPDDSPDPDPPTPDCSAQQIQGEGQCRAVLGYRWDGNECTPVSGCECTDSNCDDLFESESNCQKVYDRCIGDPTCEDPDPSGCTSDADCAEGQICSTDVEGCKSSSCQCTESGWACTDDCGGGVCKDAKTNPGNEPSCDAQDATGEGRCDALFGYKWTGSSCASIGGCECKGDDCDDLPISKQECQEQFSPCSGN